MPEYYIHADAALHGFGLPFMNNPPAWDFAAGVDSIAISGHKWLGAPLPCGIALARSSHVKRIARAVEYVGVADTTIMGSRSAFSPLMLWYGMAKLGAEELKRNVSQSIDNARWLTNFLHEKGVEALRNTHSPIVVFPRPSIELIRKWSLAPDGGIAHLVCMPHLKRETIETFLSEYLSDPLIVDSLPS